MGDALTRLKCYEMGVEKASRLEGMRMVRLKTAFWSGLGKPAYRLNVNSLGERMGLL